jgi:NhaP-type Na+/H+ or K+/H+ antiporter
MNAQYDQVFFGFVIGFVYVWFLCRVVHLSHWLSQLHAVFIDVGLIAALIFIANKCDRASDICWGVGIAVVMDLVGRICKRILQRPELKAQR